MRRPESLGRQRSDVRDNESDYTDVEELEEEVGIVVELFGGDDGVSNPVINCWKEEESDATMER